MLAAEVPAGRLSSSQAAWHSYSGRRHLRVQHCSSWKHESGRPAVGADCSHDSRVLAAQTRHACSTHAAATRVACTATGSGNADAEANRDAHAPANTPQPAAVSCVGYEELLARLRSRGVAALCNEVQPDAPEHPRNLSLDFLFWLSDR